MLRIIKIDTVGGIFASEVPMRNPTALPDQDEFDPVELQVIPRNGLPVDLSRLFSLGRGAGLLRTADRLFAALDGSEVRTLGHRFDLEVYSVTDQSSGRWLQMGLRGHHDHLVTLCLPPRSGIAEATQALSQWLANPSHLVEMLDVA
jgi:hypothetical protein